MKRCIKNVREICGFCLAERLFSADIGNERIPLIKMSKEIADTKNGNLLKKSMNFV
jgi:hypothetical protein